MIKHPACTLILILFTGHAFPAPKIDAVLKAQTEEIARLRSGIESARDSLQREIAQRYTFKQSTVEQRENDKEDMDQLRERHERALDDLARVNEEGLALEMQLTDAKAATIASRETWSGLIAATSELFDKSADGILASFPIAREQQRSDLVAIQQQLQNSNFLAPSWQRYIRTRTQYLWDGMTISIVKSRELPSEGGPLDLSIARFGNVFGYGIDTDANTFIIRQTGKLGNNRYSIDPVRSTALHGWIQQASARWIANGAVEGPVRTELLQNDQSLMLIEGKKESFWQSTYNQLKAGGAIMIPLLLLPFWAVGLSLHKGIQLIGRRRTNRRIYKRVMSLLDQHNYDLILKECSNAKSLMAHICHRCVQGRSGTRENAETAIKELILIEMPLLSRGLNTLAVIAGAAPLIGLLGTISGMITLFAAVTHYGTGDPKFLAGGISEALITAKTGLAIAIPTLFVHDFLRNTRDNLLADIEQMSSRLMHKIWTEF